MNFCINCKHIRREEPNNPYRGRCSYNVKCAAFDDEVISVVDPVFGDKAFSKTNSLGSIYYVRNKEDARPTCREVNTHGECERFEAKVKMRGIIRKVFGS